MQIFQRFDEQVATKVEQAKNKDTSMQELEGPKNAGEDENEEGKKDEGKDDEKDKQKKKDSDNKMTKKQRKQMA